MDSPVHVRSDADTEPSRGWRISRHLARRRSLRVLWLPYQHARIRFGQTVQSGIPYCGPNARRTTNWCLSCHSRSAWEQVFCGPEALGGELGLDLLGSQEELVLSVKGTLGQYIWGEWDNLSWLYDRQRSFFVPDIREEYRLRVSYVPDPHLEGRRGFVCIESGGHM